MTLCNLWPKNVEEFKRRFKELPYEACCLMFKLCNEWALGIDFQRRILYLERSEDSSLLEELIKARLLSPLTDEEEYRVELRGMECCRYSVNPYAFPSEGDE